MSDSNTSIILSLAAVKASLTETSAKIDAVVKANAESNAKIVDEAVSFTVKNADGSGISGKTKEVELGSTKDLLQAKKTIERYQREFSLATNETLTVSRSEAESLAALLEAGNKEPVKSKQIVEISVYPAR